MITNLPDSEVLVGIAPADADTYLEQQGWRRTASPLDPVPVPPVEVLERPEDPSIQVHWPHDQDAAEYPALLRVLILDLARYEQRAPELVLADVIRKLVLEDLQRFHAAYPPSLPAKHTPLGQVGMNFEPFPAGRLLVHAGVQEYPVMPPLNLEGMRLRVKAFFDFDSDGVWTLDDNSLIIQRADRGWLGVVLRGSADTQDRVARVLQQAVLATQQTTVARKLLTAQGLIRVVRDCGSVDSHDEERLAHLEMMGGHSRKVLTEVGRRLASLRMG